MVAWDNNYYHDNHLIVKCENTMLNINHTMIYWDNSVIYLLSYYDTSAYTMVIGIITIIMIII